MRTVLAILFTLGAFTSVLAQQEDFTLNNLEYHVERVPASPEVAQLGNYGNLPVDKHTGTANVSIPIHSINLDGLGIPIGLSYNTGGIRVMQEATWVGLGWNLSANAVISREINGYNDFRELANATPVLQSVGYLYAPEVNVDPTVLDPRLTVGDSTMLSTAISQTRQIYDLEPDLFTVSLFGRSFTFTLERWDGTSAYVSGINHDNAELKIRYYLNDQRFEIVDAQGFTYDFSSKELSDPYRSQGSYYSSFGGITDTEVVALEQVGIVPIDLSKVSNTITSFQLDSVSSPFGRTVYFEYEDGVHFTYPSYSHHATINPNAGSLGPDFEVYSYDNGVNVGCSITLLKTKYLKRIYGDFGEVEFVLEDRDDLYNWEAHFVATGSVNPNTLPNGGVNTTHQRRLDRIIVRNKVDTQIKLADFHYSYFNEPMFNDIEAEKYLRLKLDKVEIDDRDYHFDYLYENSLPAKDSPSVDFWGFYNGEPNVRGNGEPIKIPSFGRYVRASFGPDGDRNKYIIFDGATCSSNFNYGKVGLLKTVYFPTKGRTEFEYEGNRASVAKPLSQNEAEEFFNSPDYKYNYQYLERAEFQKQGGSVVTLGSPFTIQGASIPGNNIYINLEVSCVNGGQGGDQPCAIEGETNFDLLRITNIDNPAVFYGIGNTNGFSINQTSTITDAIAIPNGNYVLTTHPDFTASRFFLNSLEAYTLDIPAVAGDPFREYEVGGTRIKSITDYGAEGEFVSKRTYNYQENETGRSSGLLMDELIYHSKNGLFDYTPEGYNDTQINMQSSSLLRGPGNHVSYAWVTERMVDANGNPNGSKRCIYYNERNLHPVRTIGTVPEFGYYNYELGLGCNVFDYDLNECVDYPFVDYGTVYYLGLSPDSNAHLNGKILRETTYNNNGNPVNEVFYEYTTHEFGAEDGVKLFYSGSSLAPISNYAVYPFYKRVALLDRMVSTNYFDENAASPEVVATTVEYEYGSKNNVWPSGHFWPTRTSTINSEGEELVSETKFPMQSSLPFMPELVAANRRSQPVEVKTSNGTDFIAERITQYGPLDAQSDKLNPKAVLTKKRGSTDDDRVSYDLYDDLGNLLQYTLDGGPPMAYLWGYENRLYPVAKIDNAEWNDVLLIFTNSEYQEITSAGITDARMRELLDKIRQHASMQNSLVTTYTYKQGVGISSMTDPRGYTITYEYDASQRLERVRDADNNILSDTKYTYKTATIQN